MDTFLEVIQKKMYLNKYYYLINLQNINLEVAYPRSGSLEYIPREKPLGARKRTNNKLNPHIQGGKTFCASSCKSLIAGSRQAFVFVDCVCLSQREF